MRLFVALDVSDDTRAHLREVRQVLQSRLASARRAPRVTWVAEDAAHVTIRFIGEVADEIAAQVRAALSASIALAPFDIEFTGLGAFPNARRPHAVWIGAASGHDRAERLAQEVNARLEPMVGGGEARRLRMHLTLGRIKDSVPFDWPAAFVAVEPRATVTRIDHVTLYRSTTSPKGPTYTALCRTPLMLQGVR